MEQESGSLGIDHKEHGGIGAPISPTTGGQFWMSDRLLTTKKVEPIFSVNARTMR